jgi:hypothetical protein
MIAHRFLAIRSHVALGKKNNCQAKLNWNLKHSQTQLEGVSHGNFKALSKQL